MKPFVIQWPWMLCLVLLVVPLAMGFANARKKRNNLRQRLGGTPPSGETARDGMRVAAVILLVFALSRPGYSPVRHPFSQSGRDVVFAIDVSRSMLAEDAQPSRLEAAKQGVRDALARFGPQRAGLVIYAGSATILCPLTYDHDFVRYMLDQVNPRAVDFGGTTVLSAIEKSVDNIFTEERRGMQDLVILTDGEDQAPDSARVAELLANRGVDLLLVGLGDPVAESRIPLTAEGGQKTYLKQDDQFIQTKLNEEVLRELATESEGAVFVAPGTAAFDLGAIYQDFAAGKPAEGAVGTDSTTIYQEAAFGLIFVALILLIASTRIVRPAIGATALVMITLFSSHAKAATREAVFNQARADQLAERTDEALEAYATLGDGTPNQLAAVRFNQGLCHLAVAEKISETSPALALDAARLAQRSFLEAKRMSPEMARAGMRLDTTARLIDAYAEAVAKEQAKDQALQERLAAIVERLKTLRTDQSALEQKVRQKLPKHRRQAAAPEPAVSPEDAQEFPQSQTHLLAEGSSILTEMRSLDQAMLARMPEGAPPMDSLLKEPVRLMTEAVETQEDARSQLEKPASWEVAATRQKHVVQRIDEILELLAGSGSAESDEGDPEDDEYGDEDWEMSDEDGEGTPSSMKMSGDMAAGGEMQPLPKPNYSAEDLLGEEQGNMQFREQQRAKAQEGKVKNDY